MIDAISVVLRTQNNATDLPPLLARLGLRAGDDLIAVDNDSRDATSAVITAAGGRFIPWDGPFDAAATLDVGFAAARHPWVLAMSPHNVPQADALLDVYRAISPPADVVALGGPQIWARRDFPPPTPPVWHDLASWRAGRVMVGATNLLVRHDTWRQLPFAPWIPAEDQRWLATRLTAGDRIGVVPAAAALYCNRRSGRYFYHKGRDGFLSSQVYLQHPLPGTLDLAKHTARLLLQVATGDPPPARAWRAWCNSLGVWSAARTLRRAQRDGRTP